ncbi:MAG: hypothetical protein LBB65_05655 [Burkholderiales bacterium]|jgi:hypothetical protein|nr:hypothetical protein [Burkholderiales bacterium]
MKRRGQRSRKKYESIATYFAKQYAKEVEHIESLDIFSCFDLWHTHIDWESRGNRPAQARALVARMTYDLLLVTEARFAPRKKPFQIFAFIKGEDTGGNAVFVHTPNPNNNPYPCELVVDWDVAAPAELADVVDHSIYEIGKSKKEDNYFIRRREQRE